MDYSTISAGHEYFWERNDFSSYLRDIKIAIIMEHIGSAIIQPESSNHKKHCHCPSAYVKFSMIEIVTSLAWLCYDLHFHLSDMGKAKIQDFCQLFTYFKERPGKSAMLNEPINSWKPNKYLPKYLMSTDETITPTLPNVSARMWRNTPKQHKLRFHP